MQIKTTQYHHTPVRMHAKSLQSHLNLCNPMDYSPPGSSVRGDSPGKNTRVGCHALLQQIFPREYLGKGNKSTTPTSPALAGRFFTLAQPGKPHQALLQVFSSFLVAQTVKNLTAMREMGVRSLGWEDLLEKGMVTHSSILAWRISTDRGAWWVKIHRVTKSQTQLK